jgi:hypothetical protein
MAFVFSSPIAFRKVPQVSVDTADSSVHSAAVKVVRTSSVDRFPPPSPSVLRTEVSVATEEPSSLDLLAECALADMRAAPEPQQMTVGQGRNSGRDCCTKNCFTCCYTCCTSREERQGFQELQEAFRDINRVAAEVTAAFSPSPRASRAQS